MHPVFAAALVSLVALIAYRATWGSPLVEPLAISFPPARHLSDAPHPFINARAVLPGCVVGPESVAFHPTIDALVFTGMANGRVVAINIDTNQILYTLAFSGVLRDLHEGNSLSTTTGDNSSACVVGDPEAHEHETGRPLGVRVVDGAKVYVADSTFGLYSVTLPARHEPGQAVEIEYLLSSPAHNITFFDDLVLSHDRKTAYFTDACAHHPRAAWRHAVLEPCHSGRVLAFEFATRKLSVLMDGLFFPNGIEISSNGRFLYVVEMAAFRIIRVDLQSGQREPNWLAALPAYVDNLRLIHRRDGSSRLLLACGSMRSVAIEALSMHPWAKRILVALIPQKLTTRLVEPVGLVIEIDESARITRTFLDPRGAIVHFRSEADVSPDGSRLATGSVLGQLVVAEWRE